MKATAETKTERFERLAERRTTEALRILRLVGNLSNRSNYEYNDEHVRQLFDALDAEIKQLKARFRQEGASANHTFSFKK